MKMKSCLKKVKNKNANTMVKMACDMKKTDEGVINKAKLAAE